MIKYFYNDLLWEFTLTNVGVFTWLLPVGVILALRRFSKPEFRKILAFAGFSFLMEHVCFDADLKNLFSPDTNAAWFHIGTPILFLLLTRFYVVFLSGKKNGYLDILLPLVFTIVAIINAFSVNESGVPGYESFPTVTIGLYSASGIVLAASYFVYLLRATPIFRLETEPLFWVSTGMLVYFSANFLLWVGVTFLNGTGSTFFSIYRINSWMTILLNIMFVIAVISARPLKSESDPVSINEI